MWECTSSRYHCNPVRKERRVYHHHRQKARSQPEKYMCIIVDGMDQQKTSLPLLRKAAKSTQGLYRVKTHLTGTLVHTRTDHGKDAYIFIDILQWPHDSNLTINILNKAMLGHIEAHGHLPPVLYLQMDNTCRENKNRYILGYCASLVEARVFRKVYILQAHECSACNILHASTLSLPHSLQVRVNFLPVGHTHEDVDQMFSCIGKRLLRVGAESPAGMHQTRVNSISNCHQSCLLTFNRSHNSH